MKTLIVHIGAGKTGSTAIQMTLRNSEAYLRSAGCRYLGLMLEHCKNREFEWQKAGWVVGDINQADMFAEQVCQVLQEEFKLVPDGGALIWSNEQFLRRHPLMIPVVKKVLEFLGVDVKIVAYVRSPDHWARSAYFQWGVKHKTYAGKMQGFGEWISRNPPLFFELVDAWDKAFKDAFLIRSFDSVSDVVSDFTSAIGLGGLEGLKANDSSNLSELYLRAVYNSSLNEPVAVASFDRDVLAGSVPGLSIDEFRDMLPDKDALSSLWENSAEDVKGINELLLRKGQPPLLRSESGRSDDVNLEHLVGMLAGIVVSQSRRLKSLEKKLLDTDCSETRPAELPRLPLSQRKAAELSSDVLRPIILGKVGKVKNLSQYDSIDEPFRQIGNTGNIAFQIALSQRLFGGLAKATSYGASQEVLQQAGDVIVIPCANQLGRHTDMRTHAEFLEKVDFPVVAVGLGGQADLSGELPELKSGTERWLRAVCERSVSSLPNVSLRGEFSFRIMEKYGLGDFGEVLGCPSLHINPAQNLGELIASRCNWPPTKVAVTAGSYPRIPGVLEAKLADLATKSGGKYIAQHPISMVRLANGEADKLSREELESIRNLCRPNSTVEEFLTWSAEHFRVFFDIDDWQSCLREHDFVIGTRFHGVMLAIQAGVPALCIVHDSRTLELCKLLKLPHVEAAHVIDKNLSLDEIQRYFDFDAGDFDRNRAHLAGRYRDFLRNNKILLPECKI